MPFAFAVYSSFHLDVYLPLSLAGEITPSPVRERLVQKEQRTVSSDRRVRTAGRGPCRDGGADHLVRQELLPDGRHDEARGDRPSTYQGRYRISLHPALIPVRVYRYQERQN